MKSGIWPIHPHPKCDELLSSWMIRIAQENRSKIHTFYTSQFGRNREIWTRDIDHLAPDWLIKELSAHTGRSMKMIEQMTLRSLETVAFDNFNNTGQTHFILPLGVFHRTRHRFGQQFCAECLMTDKSAYFRRSWRLAFNTVCSKHKILLQDRCGNCLKPIVPHRVDMYSRSSFPIIGSMRRCSYCGREYGGSARSASIDELEMQLTFDRVIESGFANLNYETVVYSHLYFEGIRCLISALKKFQKPENFIKKRFEYLNVEERLEFLLPIFELLNQWPETFLKFFINKKAPYSAFTPNVNEIPYWLSSVLRTNLYQRNAVVSIPELTAIANVVEQTGCKSVSVSIRRISGRDPFKLFQTKRVDDDTADILLASIDHRISTATDKERLLLLRDKVMFITARCKHLSMKELLELKTINSSKFKTCTFSFWDRVETSSQVEAMINWYSQYSRMQLKEPLSEALFFAHNCKPLHKSSVGARFRMAIQIAGLSRSISGWSSWIHA